MCETKTVENAGDREREKVEKYLYYAMEIGEKMLISGAEAGRVEDTVRRICEAYGARRADVLSISASIVTTVYWGEFYSCTQSRRIPGLKNNLHMLDELNQLSRKICEQKPESSEIRRELDRIAGEPLYSYGVQLLTYALISGSFCVFFGGTLKDMIVSALIGVVLKLADSCFARGSSNPMITSLLCAVVGGLLSNLAVLAGAGDNADLISIGNVMLLIPGMAFTNAIRDIFSRDMITGGVRFLESVVLAIAIAVGFTFTNFLF